MIQKIDSLFALPLILLLYSFIMRKSSDQGDEAQPAGWAFSLL
jgi:hypothetical protein